MRWLCGCVLVCLECVSNTYAMCFLLLMSCTSIHFLSRIHSFIHTIYSPFIHSVTRFSPFTPYNLSFSFYFRGCYVQCIRPMQLLYTFDIHNPVYSQYPSSIVCSLLWLLPNCKSCFMFQQKPYPSIFFPLFYETRRILTTFRRISRHRNDALNDIPLNVSGCSG